MTSGPGNRMLRVAESLRKEIASFVVRELKDPGAAGAVVTRVEMSSDLRAARVYVRRLAAISDPASRRALVAALQRASGLLRREVTRRLGLRHAPALRFVYDDAGVDRTARVEQLLGEIAAERAESDRE